MKELRLREINTLSEANAYVLEFIEAFNSRFACEPRKSKNSHRPLEPEMELDDIFCWREDRTVSKALTVQYDKVLYLLDKELPLAKRLPRKRITIFDYADGTIAIKYRGLALPYTVFDKVAQIDQGQIVSNKRLGAELALAKDQQSAQSKRRSQKAPVRTAQRQLKDERIRQANPAV